MLCNHQNLMAAGTCRRSAASRWSVLSWCRRRKSSLCWSHIQAFPEASLHVKVAAREVVGKGRVRLDTYLASLLPDVSRAKVAASIHTGLVLVNGRPQVKASYVVRGGDDISAAFSPPEPCTATPEALPLNIVYEDRHIIVVDKAPGMVVHLSPGHTTGTLVNALLHHCGLPAMEVRSGADRPSGLVQDADSGDDDGDVQDNNSQVGFCADSQLAPATASDAALAAMRYPAPPPGVVRPGIVHRLDKGTSGLMVVAKDDLSHNRLCEQFKQRVVSRIYWSIATGVPGPAEGCVRTNIARDLNNRLRMAALPYGVPQGRTAASNYVVLQTLARGGASLVQWRLQTGRTHQIRVHAKYMGHPLLGDDTYGPGAAACARMVAGKRASRQDGLTALLVDFGRPALHALTLGFQHPITGKQLHFERPLPADFQKLLHGLEDPSSMLH